MAEKEADVPSGIASAHRGDKGDCHGPRNNIPGKKVVPVLCQKVDTLITKRENAHELYSERGKITPRLISACVTRLSRRLTKRKQERRHCAVPFASRCKREKHVNHFSEKTRQGLRSRA